MNLDGLMRNLDEFRAINGEKVGKKLVFFGPKRHFGQKCAGQNGGGGDITHKLLHRKYLQRGKMKGKSR